MRQEALWVIVIAAIASNISALAQVAREQTDPNQRQVSAKLFPVVTPN